MLNRDQIVNAPDLKTETVEVPEWGGEVLVRGLTGQQRDAFEQWFQKQSKSKAGVPNVRARLAVLSIVDEKGDRVFNDADIDMLGDKSGAMLDRVFDAVQRLSGISGDDVDEMVKNSTADQSADSTSDSL